MASPFHLPVTAAQVSISTVYVCICCYVLIAEISCLCNHFYTIHTYIHLSLLKCDSVFFFFIGWDVLCRAVLPGTSAATWISSSVLQWGEHHASSRWQHQRGCVGNAGKSMFNYAHKYTCWCVVTIELFFSLSVWFSIDRLLEFTMLCKELGIESSVLSNM